MIKGSNSHKIGKIPTTSHGVRKRPKGGNALAFGIHSQNSCLDGKESTKVFATAIGYIDDKCISQHSRTNVPKGGMMLHPKFSYVRVHRKSLM